tara:strand:- start:394 stop:519 length:126 start_codon:yes stop_codon:yes gene_type:complete
MLYICNAYSNWDYLNDSFVATANTTAYLEEEEDFNIDFDSD